MKTFKAVVLPDGKVVKDFAIVEEDGKTLQFSKQKRPDLWSEYEEYSKSTSTEEKKPKSRKKKAKEAT